MKEQPIHSSGQLFERALQIARAGRRKRVAVAVAQDMSVLEAVSAAESDGFLDAVLVGDAAAVNGLAEQCGLDITGMEMIDEPDSLKAAHRAVALAAAGDVHAVMKGSLPTSSLLKVILEKQYRLCARATLSHCAVLDIPGYHKLLNLTDGGVVVRPDRRQKFEILENAVLVGRALGLSPVKIALAGAYEVPSEKLPHSYSDADFIIPEVMAKLDDVAIQGPLPFDLAAGRATAAGQQIAGSVAGDADVYLVDSLEECNVLAKSLIRFARAVFAGVIVGATVPVSLASRSDLAAHKKASLALACLLSDFYTTHHVRDEGNG
ncbi:MAG: phosphate butyryltransferase [Candidatus Zixiibacteriota bacterium]|nr:MAG: phosphate butyryltransferase [candidate division Zixibacteria bacterium]